MEQKETFKKIVLAYSGGLDTSIIIPWLKENYGNPEIVAVSADVGQESELEGLEEKALKTGASKLYIEDLKKEFIEDYIYPTVQAGEIRGQISAGNVLCPSRHRQASRGNRKERGR